MIAARRSGGVPDPLALHFPTVADGARGLAFVEAALASSAAGGGVGGLPADPRLTAA